MVVYKRSSFSFAMRYHTDKPTYFRPARHAMPYTCGHPVYSTGTLYFHDDLGLVVIQQRYDPNTKHTWWGELDNWLIEEIFDQPEFEALFRKYARKRERDIFPTLTVRQVMWALRMKPLKKQPWETCFDRKPI